MRRRVRALRDARRLRAFVAFVMSQNPAIEGLPPASTWRSIDVRVTRSGLGVVTFADQERRALGVLKTVLYESSSHDLVRQGRIVNELLDTGLPAEWTRLLPKPLAAGQANGRLYTIEAALPGFPATAFVRDSETRQRALAAMASTIGVLHHCTRAAHDLTEQSLVEWIDQPISWLANIPAVRWAYGRQLRPLQVELRSALAGTSGQLSWIHGDYWSENVLLDHQTGLVSGIVDWDRAAQSQAPFHDVLHLLLYTRKLVRGSQLGDIVAEQLSDRTWEPFEERILAAADMEGDAVSVVLYWLRHVAENLRRDPSYATNERWIERNIMPVLAGCANGIT
jgi:hypothetical protein